MVKPSIVDKIFLFELFNEFCRWNWSIVEQKSFFTTFSLNIIFDTNVDVDIDVDVSNAIDMLLSFTNGFDGVTENCIAVDDAHFSIPLIDDDGSPVIVEYNIESGLSFKRRRFLCLDLGRKKKQRGK